MASKKLETFVGKETIIKGDVTIQHSLRVDGQVRGKLRSKEDITVGTGAKISGDIIADIVIVDGDVTGNIFANKSVHLQNNASLIGDIRTPRIEMLEGAKFNGQLKMLGEEGKMA
ncbi:polymer-forming cytoskeletal protein [candidate division KSB1 bacterium]